MITLINHQGLKIVEGIQIQTPAPPLGLAYLGAYLKENGYSYSAIDACGEALEQITLYENNDKVMIQGLTVPQIMGRILPDSNIFGFTCLFSHCWPLVVKIAGEIRRKFPDAFFVAGGEHPTAMSEQVLKTGLFNVVVAGEAEETFLELVKKVSNNQPWHEIDGIVYFNNDKELVTNKPRLRIKDINSLPYPDWDSWCIEKYIEYGQVSGIQLGKSMPILGSRGCPYNCTFCSNERMWAKRYIMRDGKALVDEMEYMKKRYNVNGFTFFDSTFIVNRKKSLDFCQELIKRNLNVTYQLPAGTRSEVFNDELSLALEKSGLRNFSFAPESGSELIREITKKHIDLEKLHNSIRSVKKTKMTLGCFIVVGFPEDNKTTMKQTLALVRKLALWGVDDLTVSQFTPYPGSEYFDELMEKGHFGDQSNQLDDLISFFSRHGVSYCNSLTAKQTFFWMNLMYINFYVLSFVFRPWRVVRNFWNYFSKGIETTRYMRFFTEIVVQRKKWKKSNL